MLDGILWIRCIHHQQHSLCYHQIGLNMSPTVFLIVLLFLTITGRDKNFLFPHFFSVFSGGGGVILFDNPKVMVGQRDLMRSSIRRFPSGDLVYVKARAIFWAPCPIGSNRSWQEAKTILPFFSNSFCVFFFYDDHCGIFFDRSLMDFYEIDWYKLNHPEEILYNSFDIFSLPLLIRYFFFFLFFSSSLFC